MAGEFHERLHDPLVSALPLVYSSGGTALAALRDELDDIYLLGVYGHLQETWIS